MQVTDRRSVRVAVRCLVAAVPLAAVTGTSSPAFAHPGFVHGTPGSGAVLATPPDRVTLTFSGPMSQDYAQLAVSTRHGGSLATSMPQVSGERATVELEGFAPAGHYRVGYRVLSAQGHPVSGSYTFTVRSARPGPGATQPGGPAAVARTARHHALGEGASPARSVPLLAGVGAALVTVTAVGARVALRRRPDTPGEGP
ncbi:copper resistance protein CopC [Streptomyces sp. NPDC005955]|uniref:copper resistance CopC family protein n=1 Tax=Streptomyces sp. NPDC005955 TaxID=3364738 RepID=UPI0036825B2A